MFLFSGFDVNSVFDYIFVIYYLGHFAVCNVIRNFWIHIIHSSLFHFPQKLSWRDPSNSNEYTFLRSNANASGTIKRHRHQTNSHTCTSGMTGAAVRRDKKLDNGQQERISALIVRRRFIGGRCRCHGFPEGGLWRLRLRLDFGRLEVVQGRAWNANLHNLSSL